MSHDPKAEKKAGIMHTPRERYGIDTPGTVKAPARTAPVIDRATVGVNAGPGQGQTSGVGSGMTKGRK